MGFLKNKKILITCGPTWVPIDTMRVISNRSTGTLGHLLAEDFTRAGAKVTLLEGPITRTLTQTKVKIIKFTFFDELIHLMSTELKKKYDICIHAAAVSDYKIKRPRSTKLSSQLSSLQLDLVPTPKIINRIKKINPSLFLIGFKLESTMTQRSALTKTKRLFDQGRCDLVVANSTRGNNYKGYILNQDRSIVAQATSRQAMSKQLVNLLSNLTT